MNHHYSVRVAWTGNLGEGTSSYSAYSREHLISGQDKYIDIIGSSDPEFRGDRSRYNPEELFLSSLSTCHMLWYLHLCADHQVTVVSYDDEVSGTLEIGSDGSGRFVKAILRPVVVIAKQRGMALADTLHEQAHSMCFMANSCNFPIVVKPQIKVEAV